MLKVTKRNTEDILALTSLQEGILFHYLKAPGGPLYFEQLRIDLSGPVDFETFKAAWHWVARANRALRTVFRWEKLEAPAQLILKDYSPSVTFLQMPEIPGQGDTGDTDPEEWLRAVTGAGRDAGFDLREVPFRVTLCRVGPEDYAIIISHHHILYDGWSTGIILKEFFGAYSSLCLGREPVPAVKPGFKDYLRVLEGRDRGPEAGFWGRYLEGVDERVSLSVKQVGEAGPEENGKIPAVPAAGFSHRLEAFTRAHKLTPAHVFYGAWGLLLAKYNHTGDVLFGTTVSGRQAKVRGIEEMVGLFINTIPLRVRFRPGETAAAFLGRLASELGEREPYESAAPAEILQYTTPPGNRESLETELYDTLMVIENYPLDQRLKNPGGNLSVQGYSMVEQAHYDLSVGVTVTDDAVGVDFQYLPAVLTRETTERLADHYLRLLENIIENPGVETVNLEMLAAAEKELVLEHFNRTGADFPTGNTIHGLFAAQVEKTPDASCLIDEGRPSAQPGRLTYGQLNQEAEHLAAYMREKGILPGGIAAIQTPPCQEMVIGILAILKAGCAYLPIAPDSPEERTRFILADSNAAALLINPAPSTDDGCTDRDSFVTCPNPRDAGKEVPLFDVGSIVSDWDRSQTNLCPYDSETLPGDGEIGGGAAYVIYTSGTTGWPKGVVVPHSAFTNRLYYLRETFAFGPGDVQLQKTVFTFDVSVCELFRCIVWGGAVVIADPELEKDMPRLLRTAQEHRITIMDFVPSMLALFLDVAETSGEISGLSRLRFVYTGVEAVDAAVVKRFRRLFNRPFGTRLVNAYGPTEAVVDMTCFDCTAGEVPDVIPIGAPISNTRTYILDPWNQPVPVGVPGQLSITGFCLAAGYLNRPELTAERFVIPSSLSPLENTSPLYYTGDMVRWRPDGNIVFEGRIDQQVKVRGFRVELGEIQSKCREYEGVKEAVVTARKEPSGDGVYLCAYLVPAGEPDIAALEEFLARKLPAYMVPACFVTLEEIPLTSSGKVNKKALPEPEFRGGTGYRAPATPVEEKMVNLWAGVLGMDAETIGMDDDFFRLGGHSLKATRLMNRVYKAFQVEIPLRQLFETPTAAGLCRCLEHREPVRYSAVEAVEKKDYYALSSAQKRLYVLQRMEPESTAYHMSAAVPFKGELHRVAPEEVFRRLVDRHESFRTSFELKDSEPVQRVHQPVDFTLEKAESGELEGWVRPFDLSRAPLLRVGIFTPPGGGGSLLLVDMHHIISDGESLEILLREAAALFKGEHLPSLAIQYKDYSCWQERNRDGGHLLKQEKYWLGVFEGEIPVLNLPTDNPRPAVRSFEGKRLPFTVEAGTIDGLEGLGKKTGATLYMVLLAAVHVLLAKLTGQEDIVIGSPVANRRKDELETIIGMFVNTLALRNFPAPGKTFRQFLAEVKAGALAAYDNQEFPFEELVDGLRLEREASRNPLFDVMFALQNLQQEKIDIPGVAVDPQHVENRTAKFDLYLEASVEDGVPVFCLEYNTRLFTDQTAERWVLYFKRLLREILRAPAARLGDFRLMDAQERDMVLDMSEGPAGLPPAEETLVSLFEKQAAKSGEQAALYFNGETLSYRELNQRANRIAARLRAAGVTTDTVVGLMMKRSFDMIAGVLGILKSGGAYLPVDWEYPPRRKHVILADSGTRLLLVNQPLPLPDPAVPEGIEIMDINAAPAEEPAGGDDDGYRGHGSNLLYVLYTSGSTGRPKGVMLEHRTLVNLVDYQYRHTGIDFSRVLQFTTICFDVSAQEIFSTLLAGGTLYLIDKETRDDIPRLLGLIREHRLTTLFLPPSFLKFVFDRAEYSSLLPDRVRHIVTAGEQLLVPPRLREFIREKGIVLHNHYGPSEAHVVTALTLDPAGSIPLLPSIGEPVSNTGIYIVDRGKRLQPVGIAGELYIGGVQLGRGYLNNPEQTAERFERVSTGFHEGLLYRTGDLARWLPEGNVEFLGRCDHQVKIRGFRIEVGEIELRLLEDKTVKEAVVTVKQGEKGEKRLCAYVVPAAPGAFDVSQVRSRLGEQLPGYMVPAYFTEMAAIPLTSGGKTDLRALPEPAPITADAGTTPRNVTDELLATLWAGVLDMEPEGIGIDDNFFHLGGHSLKGTILAEQVKKGFNVQFPLSRLFKGPTIREMARYIEQEAESCRYTAIPPLEKNLDYEVSSAQKRLLILNRLETPNTVYNLSGVQVLRGKPDVPRLGEAVRALGLRHETLRTSFGEREGNFVQVVHEETAVELTVLPPLSNPGDDEIRRRADAFIRPFDLSKLPLLRVGLIPLEAEKHLLIFDMHHIISDGVSMTLMVRDLIHLYEGRELPELTIHYKDYSRWQNQVLEGETIEKQEAFWVDLFKDGVPVLKLNTDFPRPPVLGTEGDNVDFVIDGDLSDGLKLIAEQTGATLYMVLLAVYSILLSKYSGQQDLVVGVPTAGRDHPDLGDIIGFFVNTLVTRNYPGADHTFAGFLETVKTNVLAAFENRDYPFDRLVERLDLPRDVSRNPLFDAMFVLQNMEPFDRFSELEMTSWDYNSQTSHFDLHLHGHEEDGVIRMNLEYAATLFKRDTAEKMTRHYLELAEQVVENREVLLRDLRISQDFLIPESSILHRDDGDFDF